MSMTLDIKIGAVGAAGSGAGPGRGSGRDMVEARVLAVRRARRNQTGAGQVRNRRRAKEPRDPLNASVVTLLIPDGSSLPRDLATGPYRAMVRFVRC
ncbi:MAG: hypothetical protein ACE5ID_02400 [Acidobacteriota bacterium]